jgi:hypothetical protein
MMTNRTIQSAVSRGASGTKACAGATTGESRAVKPDASRRKWDPDNPVFIWNIFGQEFG